MNRKTRKGNEVLRLGEIPEREQNIKVLDLINNTTSIVEHDADFAKVYLREKAELLKALTKADPRLLAMAQAQLADNQALSVVTSFVDKPQS
jgi:hypothetical protein